MSVQRGQGREGPPAVLALVQTCDQRQQGPEAQQGPRELIGVCGQALGHLPGGLLAGVGELWLPWAWLL